MTIGYAVCGSFCNWDKSLEQLILLCEMGYEIIPIMSETSQKTDTRFWCAADFRNRLEEVCGRAVLTTIAEAEPLGPAVPLDALVISPCTGNTLAKLAAGITDTTVCMAAKAHLRGGRPLILAAASNDALAANLKNIAALMEKKHVYFVPMVQDDPQCKPHSLVADFSQTRDSLEAALRGEQLRKVFL